MSSPFQNFTHLLGATLLVASSAVNADTQLAELAVEDYFLAPMPVVLSASRLAQSQYETPVAVTIIDRAMIDASGALEIPDLLRLVPGFQVSHAAGHTASATYHGFADEYARRMQVVIDGRPVYGPVLGGVRWTDIPIDIEDIERIEVVRGPNTAAYGANSFLGAINITTVHSSQAAGAKLKLIGGNKDTQKYYGRYGGKLGELDYRLTYVQRHDEGFKSYIETPMGIPTVGERIDSKRVSMLAFRGDYIAPNNDNWEVHLGYNGGPRGEGTSFMLNHELDYPGRTRDVDSHFQQVRWSRALANEGELSLQFYHTYMEHYDRAYTFGTLSEILSSMNQTFIPPAFVTATWGEPDERILLDRTVEEERYEIELQHTLKLNDAMRAVWGASTRTDSASSPTWFDRSDDIDNYLHRLFGNLEWRIDDITVNAGLMVEHSKLTETHTSPRLALNYQLNEHHGVRVSASRAIRMPTLFEEFGVGRYRFSSGTLIDTIRENDEDLTPERITTYEFGYLGNWPDRHLQLDAKIFHDDIEDRIYDVKVTPHPADPNPATNALTYKNAAAIQVNGIEFSLTYRPQTRTMVSFNHAYMHPRGKGENKVYLDNSQPTEIDNIADHVPRHTYSLFAMHRLPGLWDVSATYSKVDAMQWQGEGDDLKAQDRLDLRVKKGFRLGAGREAHVALTIQNALDEYLEFRDENKFDTRAYAEFGLEF